MGPGEPSGEGRSLGQLVLHLPIPTLDVGGAMRQKELFGFLRAESRWGE